jgi:hypothetical protein
MSAQTNHTDEPLHPVQIAGLRRMTFGQKMEIITMMREAGIGLRIAGLRMRNPDWTESQLETEARRAAMYASTD